MNKYFILFLLPFAILGCKKKDIFINEFTFYIDGVYYDLTTVPEKNIQVMASGVEVFRYSKTSPVDSIFYYLQGYNVTARENSAYSGQFLDRSVQKEFFFNVPDPSIYSYFWIEIDNVTYDAISGYIEIINEANLNTEHYAISHTNDKFHGTFDFVMVNRENELDTIHATNGKFKCQGYIHSETWQVSQY